MHGIDIIGETANGGRGRDALVSRNGSLREGNRSFVPTYFFAVLLAGLNLTNLTNERHRLFAKSRGEGSPFVQDTNALPYWHYQLHFSSGISIVNSSRIFPSSKFILSIRKISFSRYLVTMFISRVLERNFCWNNLELNANSRRTHVSNVSVPLT